MPPAPAGWVPMVPMLVSMVAGMPAGNEVPNLGQYNQNNFICVFLNNIETLNG